MSRPKTVVKVTRNGVEFTSNIDRTIYTLNELQTQANYDVSRFLIRRMKESARKSPSMKKLPKNRFKAIFQYWMRKIEKDILIGIKANTWYGVQQELGTKNQPKRAILRNTVFENIDDIRRIQGQYLSAIENENVALGLIERTVEESGSGDDD